MSARVEIRGLSKSYGARSAVSDVSLVLEPGTTTTLVGASGSGKTTLLRCLAGLARPERGDVLFDGESVLGVPAERRSVGVVFQSYALFPHLSVSDNLGFGLDVRGVNGAARRRRISELADELGLGSMLDRRPGEISGGERQRVALGRALAFRPVLLLLDEPLAALDPNLADSVREALRRAIEAEKTTTLLVTHDRSDALRLGERVALLREGRLEQFGRPRELYRAPATEYAANFFGAGAVWKLEVVDDGAGRRIARTALGPIVLPGAPAGPLRAVVRPEALSLSETTGSPVTIRRISYEGDRLRLFFEADGSEAAVDAPAGREFRPGDSARVAIDPSLVILLPAR